MTSLSEKLRFLRDRVILSAYDFCQRWQNDAVAIRNRLLISSMKRCGAGVFLRGRMRISGCEQMELGSNVHIGDNAFIRAEGGLVIGDNTHISRNLLLYTINHRYGGERVPYDEEMVKKSVHIGRNVWIGMNVCISPGTTVGDGAIVAMGTTVSGEVPPLAIIGGQKWRILGYREKEKYLELDMSQAYGGPDGRKLL